MDAVSNMTTRNPPPTASDVLPNHVREALIEERAKRGGQLSEEERDRIVAEMMAADLVASQAPPEPELAEALAPENRWGLYEDGSEAWTPERLNADRILRAERWFCESRIVVRFGDRINVRWTGGGITTIQPEETLADVLRGVIDAPERWLPEDLEGWARESRVEVLCSLNGNGHHVFEAQAGGRSMKGSTVQGALHQRRALDRGSKMHCATCGHDWWTGDEGHACRFCDSPKVHEYVNEAMGWSPKAASEELAHEDYCAHNIGAAVGAASPASPPFATFGAGLPTQDHTPEELREMEYGPPGDLFAAARRLADAALKVGPLRGPGEIGIRGRCLRGGWVLETEANEYNAALEAYREVIGDE